MFASILRMNQFSVMQTWTTMKNDFFSHSSPVAANKDLGEGQSLREYTMAQQYCFVCLHYPGHKALICFWQHGFVRWGKVLTAQKVLCHQNLILHSKSIQFYNYSRFLLWILLILSHLQIYSQYIYTNLIYLGWDIIISSCLTLSWYKIMLISSCKELMKNYCFPL